MGIVVDDGPGVVAQPDARQGGAHLGQDPRAQLLVLEHLSEILQRHHHQPRLRYRILELIRVSIRHQATPTSVQSRVTGSSYYKRLNMMDGCPGGDGPAQAGGARAPLPPVFRKRSFSEHGRERADTTAPPAPAMFQNSCRKPMVQNGRPRRVVEH
ncbi:hypothetical protein RHRU231_50017 [Rhodococcus ruber]|uniref:Uncharacterized protein n=1 Tax=Rhodococcus ruber TaxID=1830 RepID=A0A098BMZ9_9NOCA|nr:hypothetical protein RHRU231_50017 [Rhodococcus ruber]